MIAPLTRISRLLGCGRIFMRRLIVTGLACPPDPWLALFGEKDVRVITLHEVMEHTASADPRQMSRYVTEQIESYRPESLIAHDLGVPMTLLSLLRLNRRGLALDTKVTLFNGAFHKFDVFKANHAFRIQLMTTRRCIREIEAQDGQVDLRLKKHLPRIRAMYRLIILFGVAEKVSHTFGLEDFITLRGKFSVKSPLQIIASRNDPYIPLEALEQLRRDFRPRRFLAFDYGHYPYSTSQPNRLRRLLEEFETEPNKEAPKGRRAPARRAPERLHEAAP